TGAPGGTTRASASSRRSSPRASARSGPRNRDPAARRLHWPAGVGMKRALPLLCALLATAPLPAPAGLTTVRIAAGFSGPVWVTSPPGDTHRLFVVEFTTGRIKILKNGVPLATPFLDIGSLVTDNTNFGLLGLAFHPNYANNGYFYV